MISSELGEFFEKHFLYGDGKFWTEETILFQVYFQREWDDLFWFDHNLA